MYIDDALRYVFSYNVWGFGFWHHKNLRFLFFLQSPNKSLLYRNYEKASVMYEQLTSHRILYGELRQAVKVLASSLHMIVIEKLFVIIACMYLVYNHHAMCNFLV